MYACLMVKFRLPASKIKNRLLSIGIFQMKGFWINYELSGWVALMLSGELHNGDTVTMFCQRITQWTTGGGEIILLFGSNYTGGRGGGREIIKFGHNLQHFKYRVRVMPTEEKISSRELQLSSALNCQLNLFNPLVFLNKHRWSMRLSR